MTLNPNSPCPCGSGAKYKRCCRLIHSGEPASTPESLVRARYCAYATGRADFIMRSTHPRGPAFQQAAGPWEASIKHFCRVTGFGGLEVLGSGTSQADAWVRFRAVLTQDGRDASFTERSRFEMHEGRWAYFSGTTE